MADLEPVPAIALEYASSTDATAASWVRWVGWTVAAYGVAKLGEFAAGLLYNWHQGTSDQFLSPMQYWLSVALVTCAGVTVVGGCLVTRLVPAGRTTLLVAAPTLAMLSAVYTIALSWRISVASLAGSFDPFTFMYGLSWLFEPVVVPAFVFAVLLRRDVRAVFAGR